MQSYINNNSSGSKIEGKFYPLQTEEHLRAYRELTSTQRDLLYYLKTLDPYGDKPLNISIKGIAAQLDITRFTVSRALKALDAGGWIDLELITARVRILVKRCDKNDKSVFQVVSGDPTITLCDSRSTLCAPTITLCAPTITSEEPETPPHKGFMPSKTNKTIHTLQTLSTNENEKPKTEREIGKKDKEKFQKFAKSKMEQLPKYPVLPKRWIAMHFEELWAEYEELEGRREENEERIRESIEKPQDTVLDPIIAAGLASGKIFLDPHPIYPMLRDANGYLYKFDEWLTAEKQRLAES